MAYLGRQPNTGVRSRYIYTATASQTTFSGTDDDGKTLKYEDAAYLDVFLNGVLLKPVTDYTATSKTSVVLTSAAAASDIVEIVAYDIANIADTVSKANGGTFDAGVTVNGDLTVNSNATVTGAFTSQGIDDNATSTALTLDSSGKLLVGTTSSSQDAAFVATDSGAEVGFSFRNNATATNTASALYLQSWTADSTQAGASKISSIKDSSTYGTDLVFYTTTGSAGNTTEALRITADQRLLIGKNKAGAGSISTLGLELGPSYGMFARSGGSPMFIGRAVSTGNLVDFYWGSSTPTTFVGSISTNGSTTSYNTSSDYRLKENVTELTGAIDRIKQVPVHRFNFVADPDTTVDGFLAHEVADVVPEAIHGEKDAMRNEEYEVTPAVIDDDGNVVTEAVMGTREVPEYQGIDQSKLVPLLTAALQEAVAKIEALEARVATLENA